MLSLINKGLVKGMKLAICDDDILCIKTILDVLQDYVDELKDYVITYELVVKDGVLNIAKASFKDSWFLNNLLHEYWDTRKQRPGRGSNPRPPP